MIEILENRIAPAMASLQILNPLTATYTDVDGDRVTVKVSAGALTAGLFTGVAGLLGDQLQRLNLSGGGFDEANLTITAVKVGTGDGLVHVGAIDSTLHDLGNVLVKGDLGTIKVGDLGIANDPGILSLNVRSMGLYGTATGAIPNGDGTLESVIVGALGALKVKSHIKEALISLITVDDGSIGSVVIGGSIIGGTTAFSGSISALGEIGSLKVGGDIQGGGGVLSGHISARNGSDLISIRGSVIGGGGGQSGSIRADNGTISAMVIGKSLIGGSGNSSGSINAIKFVSAKVGGDIVGGNGSSSGRFAASVGFIERLAVKGSLLGGDVSAQGLGAIKVGGSMVGGSIFSVDNLTSLTIGGSVIGGSDDNSGRIIALDNIGPVKIGGDLIGGSISGTQGDLSESGVIMAGKSILSVTIGGSVIAGSDSSTGGAILTGGAIIAGDDIGAITVKGSLLGSSGPDGVVNVLISARGQKAGSPTLTETSDVAIGKLTIGGRVDRAEILAGYNSDGVAVNGNAQVGAVSVGKDWVASSLVAGVADGGEVGFGDAGDMIIAGGTISRIASITIRGDVVGTGAAGDRFGFEAHSIGTFKAGFFKAVLTPNLDAAVLVPFPTGDVTVREI